MRDQEWNEHLRHYMACLRARLVAGRAEYGDRSFERPATELLNELAEEALDLAGWSFILWTQIQRMQDDVYKGSGK